MKRRDLWKVIVVITVLAVVTSLIVTSFYKELNIDSFEECAAAGYPVGESYPRQCWTSGGKHFVEEINDSNRNYHSGDVEECSRTQLLCVEGMKFFSDETGCGCEVVDGKKQNFCSDESRNADVCITLYDPVCGWNNPEEIQCIKFPCASTYSNSCNACKNSDVFYWTSGLCPE